MLQRFTQAKCKSDASKMASSTFGRDHRAHLAERASLDRPTQGMSCRHYPTDKTSIPIPPRPAPVPEPEREGDSAFSDDADALSADLHELVEEAEGLIDSASSSASNPSDDNAPAVAVADVIGQPPELDHPPSLADAVSPESRRHRGWGDACGGAACESFPIQQMEPPHRVVGAIKINVRAHSLDAHCRFCKANVNRTYIRRGHRGHPMGTLVAWLCSPCNGTPSLHRAHLHNLSHDARAAAREWGLSLGLDRLFELEGDRDAGEPEEPLRQA